MPLAIDLFCGLAQPKLGWSAYSLVNQFVACGAENPNHVSLAVRHKPPRPVPLMSWFMGYLKHAPLWACFAGLWKVWILPPQTFHRAVPVGTARIVDLLNVRLSLMIGAPMILGGRSGAYRRTISAIAGWWRYLEVIATYRAISPSRCHIRLLTSAPTSGPTGTGRGAIAFVGPNSRELAAAIVAKQVVHKDLIS